MLENRLEEKQEKLVKQQNKYRIIMKKINNKNKRRLRVRNKIKGTNERPRISVRRSNQHIIAQIINDESGETLVGMSTISLKDFKGTKSEQSFELGKRIGNIASKKKIKKVVLDRGFSKYHGRVKQFAEGAREAGLEF